MARRGEGGMGYRVFYRQKRKIHDFYVMTGYAARRKIFFPGIHIASIYKRFVLGQGKYRKRKKEEVKRKK
jgi:hypothetical protein